MQKERSESGFIKKEKKIERRSLIVLKNTAFLVPSLAPSLPGRVPPGQTARQPASKARQTDFQSTRSPYGWRAYGGASQHLSVLVWHQWLVVSHTNKHTHTHTDTTHRHTSAYSSVLIRKTQTKDRYPLPSSHTPLLAAQCLRSNRRQGNSVINRQSLMRLLMLCMPSIVFRVVPFPLG